MIAVSLMLDVAFHSGRTRTVSASDIAERLGVARRGMEPVLQALSRAGLLESVRGPHGGYRLGRPRRDIRLSQIVATVQADPQEPAERPMGALHGAVVDKIWAELEQATLERLAALTLEDLLRRAAAAGLRRPSTEPITFAI